MEFVRFFYVHHIPPLLATPLLNEKNINFHEVLHDFIDHRMSFQIFISLHSGHINVYSKLYTSSVFFCMTDSVFPLLVLYKKKEKINKFKNWCCLFLLFIILEIKKKSIKLPKYKRAVCGDVYFSALHIYMLFSLFCFCGWFAITYFQEFLFLIAAVAVTCIGNEAIKRKKLKLVWFRMWLV